MITMGGNAEIELIDSMDPFSEGRSCACEEDHQLTIGQGLFCPSCRQRSRGER